MGYEHINILVRVAEEALVQERVEKDVSGEDFISPISITSGNGKDIDKESLSS